ncbi:MAG: alpha/beta hydrolase-fold protein [Planctomycetota bacterium]
MLRILLVAACPLFLVASSPAQRGDRQDRPAAPPLQHFTSASATFKSPKITSGEAGYSIWLPKQYGDEAKKDTKYPWALWLPGFGGTDEFERGGGIAVLDRLTGEGKVPPMAFVVFRSPGRRGRSVYTNGEGGNAIEDAIVVDLVAHLEATYRLIADKKARALMGVSAGGFGALKIAMRHPDVFGAVAAHSSAILPADPSEVGGTAEGVVQRQLQAGLAKELGDPIDPAKWAAHMPLGIVATRKPEEMAGLHIYFDAGTEDDYGFCPPNEELARKMTERGFAHVFRKVEGGGHAFGSASMKDNVAVSLQYVGAAISGKDPAAAIAAFLKKPAAADEKKEAGK